MPRRLVALAVAALTLAAAVAGALVARNTDPRPPRSAALAGLPPLIPGPPLTRAGRREARREALALGRVLRYTRYVTRGVPRRREIALTFDDGPSSYTAAIERTLRRMHVPATFFVVGVNLGRYPRAVRSLVRHGFVIGNHTVNHPPLGRLPVSGQRSEIHGTARRLRRLGVARPNLFRPPYGSFNHNTLALMRRERLLMVLWSVDPSDWNRPGRKAIVRTVLAGARPGAIVLMHDGGGPREQTAAALPAIIRGLRRRGYGFVTVPRLVADNPPPRRQPRVPRLGGPG